MLGEVGRANVLVYLLDADSPERQQRAREILRDAGPGGRLVLSTQVLQEFFDSVTRKLERPLPAAEAGSAASELAALDVVEIDVAVVLRGTSLARRHILSLCDALIVEAALARGCTRLLTEGMQAGRRFGELVVENPFG